MSPGGVVCLLGRTAFVDISTYNAWIDVHELFTLWIIFRVLVLLPETVETQYRRQHITNTFEQAFYK